MVVQYFDVIHCVSQEQVTDVINKLHDEQELTWLYDNENPLIKDPARFELEQKFFQNVKEVEKEEFYIATVKFADIGKCIVYMSRKKHDIDTMRAALAETDKAESSKNTVFWEAENFLGSFTNNGLFETFSIDYDVYDTSNNLIGNIKNKEDLSKIYNEAVKNNITYIVYVGTDTVEINDSHNIDYYDSRIVF